jgi:hypothetical protein
VLAEFRAVADNNQAHKDNDIVGDQQTDYLGTELAGKFLKVIHGKN